MGLYEYTITLMRSMLNGENTQTKMNSQIPFRKEADFGKSLAFLLISRDIGGYMDWTKGWVVMVESSALLAGIAFSYAKEGFKHYQQRLETKVSMACCSYVWAALPVNWAVPGCGICSPAQDDASWSIANLHCAQSAFT